MAVIGIVLFAAHPALAADLDRSYATGADYDRFAGARIEPPCINGYKAIPLVLHCTPRRVLPIVPETSELQETYLDLGHRYREPYRQLFHW